MKPWSSPGLRCAVFVLLVGEAIRAIYSSIPRSHPGGRLASATLAYPHPPSLDRLLRGDSCNSTETMHQGPRTTHLLAEKNAGLKNELDSFEPCTVLGLLPFNPPVRCLPRAHTAPAGFVRVRNAQVKDQVGRRTRSSRSSGR